MLLHSEYSKICCESAPTWCEENGCSRPFDSTNSLQCTLKSADCYCGKTKLKTKVSSVQKRFSKRRRKKVQCNVLALKCPTALICWTISDFVWNHHSVDLCNVMKKQLGSQVPPVSLSLKVTVEAWTENCSCIYIYALLCHRPSWGVGKANFFMLLFQSLNHPHVTAVAHKRNGHPAKSAGYSKTHSPHVCSFAWSGTVNHGAWLYGVHRTYTKTAAVSRGTSHVTTEQCCKYTTSESEYLLSQYKFTRKFVLWCTVGDRINNRLIF